MDHVEVEEVYEFKLEMHRYEVEALVRALNRVDSGDNIRDEDYKILAEIRNVLAPLLT